MKNVAQSSSQDLATEERNLLSVAYKNVVGARRASWRIVSSIEQKELDKNNNVAHIKKYKEKIEAELKDICEEIITILTSNLLPQASTSESKVFYHKMTGDYQVSFCDLPLHATPRPSPPPTPCLPSQIGHAW